MVQRTCSIDGCDKPHLARGWCGTHYKRWQKYGDPHRVYQWGDLNPKPATTVQQPCEVDGCPRWARGVRVKLCEQHYKRSWKYGDPNILKSPRNMPVSERLASKTTKMATCWLWTGNTSKDGYGTIGIGPRTYQVHRVAHELQHGPIPDGLEIDHLCRNRACVNPAHLELVTHAENVRRGAARRARPSH